MSDVFTYQTLHVNARRVRYLERHIELLNIATQQLFQLTYDPNRGALIQRILAMATPQRHASDRSLFIQLRVDNRGGESLHFEGVSLYDGYVLRTISPRAIALEYQSPLAILHTSATLSIEALVRLRAQAQGFDVALQCDHNGKILAGDGSPILAIRGRDLIVPTGIHSVEMQLAIEAAHEIGIKIIEEVISINELRYYDEMMIVDHRGLTSLRECNGRSLMPIICAKIAEEMEHIAQKL